MARRILTQREQFAYRFADAPAPGMPCDPTKDPSQGGCATAAPSGPVGAAPIKRPVVPAPPSVGGPSSGPSAGPAAGGGAAGGGGPGAPVNYNPGGGAEQWRSHAEEALRRNNQPVNDETVNAVLHQITTESSGNPNAINLTDSNAQAGHPSQGLLQTIPSTFQQYHLQGDSGDITDPQANLDAAVNYSVHTYGPIGQGNAGIGSGHGY
jgi:soluble lytic murein transglycosylase-like protein